MLNDNNINLNGYTYYVNNRKVISAHAIRDSEGVAILVNDLVIQNFIPKLKADNVGGIIGIELQNIYKQEILLFMHSTFPLKISMGKHYCLFWSPDVTNIFEYTSCCDNSSR